MKKIFLIAGVVMLFIPTVWAQEASLMRSLDKAKLAKMIELAKANYPKAKVMELNEQKAKSVYRSQPIGYLDLFNVSYFYRPNDRLAMSADNPFVFNGFQYGVNLNLSSLLQRPFLTKQAKTDYKITQLERQEYETTLELEVKRRYYEYIRVLEDFKIRTQALSDNKVLLEDAQLRFERGEIDLETYAAVKTSLSGAQAEILEVEMALLLAKDALEEIVGVELAAI